MKHLDLFSGIGGFALAARWMNWETIQFVEIDKFCQKVLNKNFPNVPIHGDIKTFDGSSLRGTVDILTGGFPCQPFSVAGQRKGKEDDRYLWPEMLRVIGEIKPRWIVGENVAGISGMALHEVLSSLEDKNYHTETYIIPACAVNAPHRRDRFWILAYSEGNRNKRIGRTMEDTPVTSEKQNDGMQSYGEGKIRNVTNPNGIELQRRFNAINDEKANGHALRSNTLDRTTGFKNFPSQSSICGGNDGISPELDIIRKIDEKYSKESITKANEFKWKALRAMWEYREFAEASPNVYNHRVYNSVSIMPHKGAFERWELGKGYEETEKLRCLWSAFYTKSFEEAQDLQCQLLEYFRENERRKAMEKKQRVNRIKSLGNAIVPQVAFEIFKAIESVDLKRLL